MPPRLAICQKSSAPKTRTPSQPSCRISDLFVRGLFFAPAFCRSPLLHSCWAAPAAGGMPVLTEYARTRPDPFLVGISGVLKKQMRLPPGTPAIPPWSGMGDCGYPMRGCTAVRGSPPPAMPRRAAGLDAPP